MTKQHFIEFARQIHQSVVIAHGVKGQVDNTKLDAAIAQCSLVCNVASQFNPRFDRARFVAACGLKD